jgi:hypothetical protein
MISSTGNPSPTTINQCHFHPDGVIQIDILVWNFQMKDWIYDTRGQPISRTMKLLPCGRTTQCRPNAVSTISRLQYILSLKRGAFKNPRLIDVMSELLIETG